MRDSLRMRTLLAGLGTLCLAWHLGGVHRWFASPFATWVGWDEAYIAAFGQRMIEGHWLPYVDAVSHRGPVLYWVAAVAQALAGGNSWAAMRHASLLFAEANVLLIFALGALARRPLAGFLGAATFVFVTAYSMEPKDGISFNGELVAMPFVLLAAALAVVALREREPGTDARISLAAASGALVMIGALSKQPAGLHLVPIALWFVAVAIDERTLLGRLDLRPLLGLLVGALTPALATVAYFVLAGAWRPFSYYLFTYNRTVYMGPVSIGYAIESSFLFWRQNAVLLLVSLLAVTWAATKLVNHLEGWRASSWASAFARTAMTTTTALQLMLGLVGAVGTFRFWDHYFIMALPWFGLMAGLLVEHRFEADDADNPPAVRRAYAIVLVCFVVVSFVQRHATTLWLDGIRGQGVHYLDPKQDPIAGYIREHTPPERSVFVWGFAPELYVSSGRRSASRFVFTTFPAGLVPWFAWLSPQQEDGLAVPGARALLLQELDQERPPLIVDVPNSMHGRSMRRYPELAAHLQRDYCFVLTIFGHNGRVADIYHRRPDDQPCRLAPPPVPEAK